MVENVLPTTRLVPRIVCGVVVCVGGVALLYGTALFFLLLPDRNFQNRKRAQTQMLIILGEMEAMVLESQRLPKSIEDILTYAQRSSDSTVAKMSGLDPWGTPYQVEAAWGLRCNKGIDYYVTVQSFGRNRRDDLGKGDDLQLSRPGWVKVPQQIAPAQESGEPAVTP